MLKKITIGIIVLSMLLISGCVQIDIYQKIKRNGHVDMSLTFKAESMILNAFKTNIEVEPSMKSKYTYEETDDSVTYKFTDIDPFKDNLFKQEDNGKTDTSMFNKDNYHFKKEFKFPYYYYTYEIEMKDTQQEESKPKTDNTEGMFDTSGLESAMSNMFKVGYTIEVFGKITGTNGNKMSDNKVKFNIGINENKKYYVTFRDFFISSWIGSIF